MMTREEAIKILQHLAEIVSSGDYQEAFKMAVPPSAPSAGSRWRRCVRVSGYGTMKKSEVPLKELRETGAGGALNAKPFCLMISMTQIIHRPCAFANGAARP